MNEIIHIPTPDPVALLLKRVPELREKIDPAYDASSFGLYDFVADLIKRRSVRTEVVVAIYSAINELAAFNSTVLDELLLDFFESLAEEPKENELASNLLTGRAAELLRLSRT